MGQVSQPSVRYRLATDPGIRCGTCVMFHPLTGTCDLVEGLIAADHVREENKARRRKAA